MILYSQQSGNLLKRLIVFFVSSYNINSLFYVIFENRKQKLIFFLNNMRIYKNYFGQNLFYGLLIKPFST